MSSVNLKRQQKINSQMNEVMDEFDRFEYFFATHWKKIVAVAILVVVGVGVYAGITYAMKRSSEKAAQAYSSAKNLTELEAAVAQYKNPPAWVNVKLASYYIEKKDYAKAATALQAAAQDSSAPEFQWRAMINLALLKEMQGKYKEAAEEAMKTAKIRVPGSTLYAIEGYIAAARNYDLAGDKVSALKTIDNAKVFLQGLPPEQRSAMLNYNVIFNIMASEINSTAASK